MKLASNAISLGALLSCLLLAHPARGEDIPEKKQLIEGALARSKAIVSGKLKYRKSSGMPTGKNRYHSEYVVLFVFSGTSWRATYDSIMGEPSSRDMASHRGAYFKFDSAPQPDGSVYRYAEIYLPTGTKPLGERSGPPVFAGSFWHGKAAESVLKQPDEVALTESKPIDGIPVYVLECSIPEDRTAGTVGPVPSWLMGQPAIFRISVAPGLGYALPTMDYLAADGRLVMKFTSSNFTEVAPAIFFPNRCECQYYESDGARSMYFIYEFEDISRINEAIADEEFIINVPGDTDVSDYRDPLQPIHFLARQAAAAGAPDVSEVVQFGTERPASVPGWRRWQTLPMAILLGVNIGVVGLLGYYIWRRRRARSAS